MHVIEPKRYRPRKVRRKWERYVALALLVLTIAGAINYLRPLSNPQVTLHISLPVTSAAPVIDWPGSGKAAIAAEGYGLLGVNGSGDPLATASIAKVILALCVLQKQPLALGQAGPTYTIDKSDVAIYQHYVNLGGSLIPVVTGEELTQYQALEALMVPSANNVADSLVRWVFGSQDAYSTYATNYLREHELNQTHIGADASGFDPATTSTATDLTNLGLLALRQPVLMQIASQKTATLPVVGRVANYNTMLGVNGINGLKTGNSDADPGAFLFTASLNIGGKTVPCTGVVMGAPDLDTALQSSAELAVSLQQGFEQVTVLPAGSIVGSLHTVWGVTANISSAGTLELVRWKGTRLNETHKVDATKRSGVIGELHVTAGQAQAQTTLRLNSSITGPSFWWRLTRH